MFMRLTEFRCGIIVLVSLEQTRNNSQGRFCRAFVEIRRLRLSPEPILEQLARNRIVREAIARQRGLAPWRILPHEAEAEPLFLQWDRARKTWLLPEKVYLD